MPPEVEPGRAERARNKTARVAFNAPPLLPLLTCPAPMPPAPSSGLFGRLLLLFALVPILDLALLIWIGQHIGFWPTVGLIVGTALLGSFLARRAGLSVLARFRARLASGTMPGSELTDGLIILVAGVLLLTPGVLTDVVGLLGLFPPTRAPIRRALTQRFQHHVTAQMPTAMWPPTEPPPPASPTDDGIVDVEFEDLPPR